MKIKCCRRNVAFSELWVNSHEKPSDFYASSFLKDDSAWPLLLIRLLLFSVAVAILSWSLYQAGSQYWVLFLTNWGMMLVAAMLLSGVIVSFKAVADSIPDDKELPTCVRIYWCLYNVTISLSLLITLLYWTLIYGPALKLEPRAFWLEVCMHGVNSMLVLIELLVSRTPVMLLHLYQPLCVGLWYAAFSAIYYYAGGTDGYGSRFIYEVLNWQFGKRSLFVVFLAAVVQIVIYFFVYGMAAVRDKFSAKSTMNAIDVPPEIDGFRRNFVSNV